MAEGYNRASGKIGICMGTSGPAGTDMVTGLYSAQADSIPILCITGQAPRSELHREYFQAVRYRRHHQAGHQVVGHGHGSRPDSLGLPGRPSRSCSRGRPGPVHIDLPIDIQKEIIEYDPETDVPLKIFKPTPDRKAIRRALEMMCEAKRPVIIAGGGVVSSGASEELVKFARTAEHPGHRRP